MSQIHVENLRKTYYGRDVLRDISFEVSTGEMIAIIGPNGSGKSTLAKLMIGLDTPTGGKVRIDGKKPAAVGSHIGYVPQRFYIDRDVPLTVREFLDLALCTTHEHKHAHTIGAALERVGMQEFVDAQVGTLSGGELQRVLIARALLHERSILLLDEPEAGIDIEGEAELYSTLHAINKEFGTTIIVVSHELETVMKHVDRVIALNCSLVFDATPSEIASNDTLLKELYHPSCTTCSYC